MGRPLIEGSGGGGGGDETLGQELWLGLGDERLIADGRDGSLQETVVDAAEGGGGGEGIDLFQEAQGSSGEDP